MEYIIICTVAIMVSALTFFSGFGLGTLLVPAFALFFPIPLAIAATAVVHLANNIFKLGLIGKNANWPIALKFATPALFTAAIGAALLTYFDTIEPLYTYQLAGKTYQVTVIKLTIGIIISFFALFDLLPRFKKLSFDAKFMPLGGAISGLFGGLSGNQGALRSAFLIKAGLSKEAFIGTGVVIAIIIDVSRLLVYGFSYYQSSISFNEAGISGYVVAATLAAFIGAMIGKKLLTKITMRALQIFVGILLITVGISMAFGLL